MGARAKSQVVEEPCNAKVLCTVLQGGGDWRQSSPTHLYRAQVRGNVRAVHSLQRLLLKSGAARMVAVRRVTQDNQGKQTAGVDGIKAVGPQVRLLFVARLRAHRTIQPQPVRRVYIPKPGKAEQRPLGIPTLFDRAHQALVKQALEPQWEARFEPNSYGFRPGRSCHDALEALHKGICHQPKYVLDADIQGCFDHIDRQALLAKLDSIPAIRRAVKGWLRAGVLDGGVVTPTSSGTPQGGVVSPLLANIALHGLEDVARQAYRGRTASGAPIRPALIRYADDFVILGTDLAGIQAAQEAVGHWLAGMGLQLSPRKTHLTHTLTPYEGRVGFDFPGCTIRQFPAGKTHSGKRSNGTLLGFRTRITPSTQAVSRHLASTRTILRQHRTAPQAAVIDHLNPRIRGWAAYYRSVASSRVYALWDHRLFAQLWHWARRRHPRASRQDVARRYWLLQPGARWVFAVKEAGEVTARLRTHYTPHRRYVKVRGTASPYDGNLVYWARRLREHPLTDSTLGRLLAAQGGKCARCGLLLRDTDLLEIDHCLPTSQGGSDHYTNQQVLHRHCHHQKTVDDLHGRVSLSTTT